jgi:Cu/Ag efflux pump CusA
VIKASGNALWVSPLSFLDASTPGTGGWIETPNQRLGVQHVSPISTAEELADVVVEGTIMRLGDLTAVVEDHQPLIGDAFVEDAPSLMLVLEKFPWANTVDVTRDVEEALESLRLGLSGVEMDSSLFRPATYLELAADNLATALLIGLALVVVALLGLLFSWRRALISAMAVLLSALVAGAVLYVSGVTINLLIIAGFMVALAAVIDDSIIDVQNVAKRLRENAGASEEKSIARVIFEAAVEMRNPIVYATLIALLAIVPLFFIDGVSGVFSQTVAASYALALLASMLVALTITPALSLLLLGGAAGGAQESPLTERLQRGVDRIVSRTARAAGSWSLAAVGALGVAVLLGAVAFPGPGDSLLPQFRERDILVELEGAPGTSEREMSRMLGRVGSELRSISGVRTVSAHLGRAVLSDRVEDVNTSELWVSLDRRADYDATVAAIRETVDGYPGFDIDVDTYLTQQIRDEAEIEDALRVRVYGEELDTIRGKAEEVRRVLSRVDGIVDPEVEFSSEHPNLEIEVNLAKAREHGLKPGDVRRAVATLVSGIEVGNLFDDQKVFDVVVWGAPEIRQNLSDIEDLLIDTPPPWRPPGSMGPAVLGGHVRLGDVADLRIGSAPQVINREAVARHIDVSADVEGRDFAAVSAEVEERIRQEVDFPLEYRAEVLGEFAAHLATRERVRAFAAGAAIGILLLLQAAFGSWGLAFSLFLAVPVALLGGVLTGLAGGSLVSLGSILGFLAVFGIAVRNGLTLISHYRQLERGEGGSLSAELVRRGTVERCVPIVMTAVVTALAFLPFAVLGNIAGHEIMYPMAMVIIGGVVSAALVSLFIVPSLYLRFGAGAEPEIIVEQEPRQWIA